MNKICAKLHKMWYTIICSTDNLGNSISQVRGKAYNRQCRVKLVGDLFNEEIMLKIPECWV